MLYQVPRWQREVRSNIRDLNREVANALLDNLIDDLHKKYSEMAEVITYLQAMTSNLTSKRKGQCPSRLPSNAMKSTY